MSFVFYVISRNFFPFFVNSGISYLTSSLALCFYHGSTVLVNYLILFFYLPYFRWKIPIRIAPIKAFLSTHELNKIPQVCLLLLNTFPGNNTVVSWREEILNLKLF